MASICCKAETYIGYYNINERPDIHGIVDINSVIGIMGTYCNKCNKLCDFTDDDGNEYYTNGLKKNNGM